nr:hypothetical protein [Verrucomicrobiales bacterium]
MTLRSALFVLLLTTIPLGAADYRSIPTEPTEGDRILADYFDRETRRLTARNAAFLENVTDWPAAQ